jgi:hypothetical protein
MCRRPLAYGHATATRILLGFSQLTGANDRESPSGHLGTEDCAAEEGDGEHGNEQESVQNARTTVVGRVVDSAHAWIGGALRPCRTTGGPSVRLIVSS